MFDIIFRFQTHVERTRSARTATAYVAVARALVAYLEKLGAEAPTESAIAAFLARPCPGGRRRAATTYNHELAALRVLSRFAATERLWASDPARQIVFVRGAVRDPAVLSVHELQRFFRAAACEGEPSRRALTLALLALLSQAGLRVHELVALNAEQLDDASATLVGVRGKGGTVHDVPLNARTLDLLRAWFERRAVLAPEPRGPMFVSRDGTRLSIRSVQRVLARLRTAVGTAKHVTPHTLRHTTATLALTLGADLSTVGDLLRHSDLNTTRRYLHLVDERRREAVRRLEVTIPRDIASHERIMSASKTIDSADLRESDHAVLDAHDHLGDIRPRTTTPRALAIPLTLNLLGRVR